MKMSLYASVLCGAVFYSFSLQAACVTPPDCADLGYTSDASKCTGAALKCPWDLTKAACKEKEDISVGAILYGDGTVSKDIISGKIPIGIVFDHENRLAMALTDVKKDGTPGTEGMLWSNNYYDIPGLENCDYNKISYGTDLTPITCGTDGRLNTDVILACGSSCGGTPAATAANSYQPADCTKDFCKKTKWFLPSIRDLQNIYIAKDQLNTTLTSLSGKGAAKISEYWYWSSTENGNTNAWEFYMSDGFRNNGIKDTDDQCVRPVVKF